MAGTCAKAIRHSKKISYFAIYLFVCTIVAFGAFATKSDALEIEVEDADFGPLGGFLTIYLSGPIEPGDAAQLRAKLSRYDITPTTQVGFSFNSPGGSVVEGMQIGQVIAGLPHGVWTSVGGREAKDRQMCASACVLAFLGGHYRSASPGSLGVHQFFFSEDSKLSGAEATSVSQMMAADIVDYIREMRADPEFFSVMTRSYPDEMHWVPQSELERLRVLNGDVFDETEEYKNSDGNFYLRLWQQSRNGENKIVIACVDGKPLTVAYLQPPEIYMNGSFNFVIDGDEFEPNHWEVVRDPNSDGNRWVEVLVRPSPALVQRLVNAASVGARMEFPSGQVFFGFEMTLRSPKVRDTLTGCRPSTSNSAAETARAKSGKMVDLQDFDLPYNDLLQNGVKGLSFEQCKQLCLGIDECQAVSWVRSKSWCWPKGQIGVPSSAQGIFSAIRR